MLAALLLLEPSPILKVSTARLTPPEPLALGGYTARGEQKFQEGGQDLMVRSLTVGPITIASVELLTIPESLVEAVRKRVPGRRIMLVATHTHCAPDSQMLNSRMTMKIPGIASYSPKWLNWYADKIAECILAEGEIVTGETDLIFKHVPLGRSRRPAGSVSQRMTRMTSDGTVIFDIYSAHPTIFAETELKLNGDWPGALMRRTGGLVFPGAIGDASPATFPNLTSQENCDQFARILDTASGVVHPLEGRIAYWQQPITLPKKVAHPEFASSNGIPQPMANSLVEKFAPDKAEISFFYFRGLLVIGVPGEPTGQLGLSLETIAREKGFDHAVTISHCNGWIGYLLEAPDYQRGGYEATLSFNGSEIADRVRAAVREGLENGPDVKDRPDSDRNNDFVSEFR